MPTWAVGDVQGCYDEFRALLDKIEFESATDTLWLVGDLVNRGPNNVDTLDFVMSLPNVRMTLGNHDLHLIMRAHGFVEAKRSDTLDDVLASPRIDAFVEFLRHQPLIHVDADRHLVMSHAGLPPIWDVETAIAHAAEVERCLAGDDYQVFLKVMYGNEPDAWSDELEGFDRLRLITNYFTRLRYTTADGRFEGVSKENIQPAGYAPWFSFPRPDEYTVLFGHWAAISGETGDANVIGLDTGCVWGGRLSAYRLDDGARVSVPSTSSKLRP